MKKFSILLMVLALALPLAAQHDGKKPSGKRHLDVSEVVDDLSTAQKRKIETISKDSRERVEALRAQQHAVRDSIGHYMDLEGDHSRELHPLFEREARLQVSISREMYATKLRIDEVLTREQRQVLRQACQKKKGE